MNYEESAAYIESLTPTILNPDLARFACFMQENGKIQDKFHSIHVAGTNGKGSTVAILDSVLRASGLRVGRCTGPHLLRWNERFHVQGEAISDENFADLCTRIRVLSEDFGVRHPDFGSLSWFEFLTALAFFYFYESSVDVAVVEVGLGGRWDATNVLSQPLVSVITSIDFDHTHILGSTLTAIAGEKAGIIKPNVPLITAASGEALEAIKNRATEIGAPMFVANDDGTVIGPDVVDLAGFKNALGSLALPGVHQTLNSLVAYVVLALCEKRLGVPLLSHAVAGFTDVFWPGRLQFIPERNLILDGAHNVGGITALRSSLDSIFPGRRRIFVLSFFENKNVQGALTALLMPGDRVFISEAKTHRAVCPSEKIAEWSRSLGAEATCAATIGEAFDMANKARAVDDLVAATGSFSTVKDCMIALGWASVEDGRQATAPVGR